MNRTSIRDETRNWNELWDEFNRVNDRGGKIEFSMWLIVDIHTRVTCLYILPSALLLIEKDRRNK